MFGKFHKVVFGASVQNIEGKENLSVQFIFFLSLEYCISRVIATLSETVCLAYQLGTLLTSFHPLPPLLHPPPLNPSPLPHPPTQPPLAVNLSISSFRY